MICKDIEIIQKTNKAYELIFTEDGSAIDITGWTIYFTVKENMKDSDANAKIDKKFTSHDNATNGKTTITLTSDDTDIEIGNYYYSIDYKDDEDQIGILVSGRLKLEKVVRQTKD